MTQSELKKVKDFYEQVILQGLIKPLEINEIYTIIKPEEKNPLSVAYRLKQRTISVFIQNKQWETLKMLEEVMEMENIAKDFDSTETAFPQKGESDSLSLSNEGQSHSEDKPKQKRVRRKK